MSGSIQYKVLFLSGREGRRGTHPWERSSFCGQQSVKEEPHGKTVPPHTDSTSASRPLLYKSHLRDRGRGVGGVVAASSQRRAIGSYSK